jgi:hypothetical protein
MISELNKLMEDKSLFEIKVVDTQGKKKGK